MGEDVRELPFKERKAFLAKNRAAMPAGKDRTVHRRRSPAVQRRMQARPRGHLAKRMGRPLRPGNDLVQDSQSDVFSERRSGRVIRETSGIGVNVRKWQNIDPVDRSELLQQFRVPIVKTDNLGELRPITGLVLNYLSPDFYAAE